MALIKIEPYIIDTTGDFTFNNVTATGNLSSLNATLGNLAIANFFSGSGNNLSNISSANISGQVGNALLSGTVYTNAQPNITSVGTLSNLTSNGTINFANTSNVTLGAVANLHITGGASSQYLQTDGAGTLTWAGISSSSTLANGNSQVDIPVANGNINITSVGNTTVVVTGTGVNIAGTLNTTGNANVGNLGTAGLITATGNITGGNLLGSHANGNSNVNMPAVNGNINLTAVGNTTAIITGTGVNVSGTLNTTGNITGGGELNLSGNGIFGGNLTVNGTLTYINSTTLSISDPIINLQTGPNGAAPVANTGKDVGTALNYYDTSAKISWMGWDISNAEIAFGSEVSISAEVVTFTALANVRSGNANLGNNVSANYFTGNGSQLSALTFGNITTFTTAGLTTDELYLQGTTRLNVTASGNSGYLFDQYGATVNPALYVTSGQTLAFNLNVTGHPFLIQTSGGANYSVGLEYVDATGTVLTTSAAQGQITGTLYWKIPYGITGNYKYQCSAHGGMNGNIVVTDANVANITVGLATYATTANSVAGGNVTGTVANATYALSSGTAGTVTTNAQPNITSVGNLTGLTVSNATGVVDFANTGNVTLGVVGNLHISGGIGGYVLSTDGSGTLSWVAQSGGGTPAYIANGNSNVTIATAGGNVTTSVNGNVNILVVTGTGANISGTLQVSGQSNLGNVGNVRIIGGSNNQFLQTDGTGNLTWSGISSSSTLANGNSAVTIPTIDGNINFTANNNTSFVVTSTGVNVSGTLNTTGNVSFTGANVSLGNVGNVKITGGTANYVLSTNGSGNLSWVAQSGGGGTFFQTYTASSSPPGSPAIGDQWYNTTTQVLYEYANVGTANFWLDIQSPVTASAVYTTYINRNYTADGVVKIYTITLGCGVNDVLVFLNGICQMPTTDYTVSGTTLTLDTLPVAGVIIQIREMPR